MRISTVIILFCLALTGCNGLDLGDNPTRDVAKQSGPLVAPPPHLKDGSSE
jgi:hypothetical protein